MSRLVRCFRYDLGDNITFFAATVLAPDGNVWAFEEVTWAGAPLQREYAGYCPITGAGFRGASGMPALTRRVNFGAAEPGSQGELGQLAPAVVAGATLLTLPPAGMELRDPLLDIIVRGPVAVKESGSRGPSALSLLAALAPAFTAALERSEYYGPLPRAPAAAAAGSARGAAPQTSVAPAGGGTGLQASRAVSRVGRPRLPPSGSKRPTLLPSPGSVSSASGAGMRSSFGGPAIRGAPFPTSTMSFKSAARASPAPSPSLALLAAPPPAAKPLQQAAPAAAKRQRPSPLVESDSEADSEATVQWSGEGDEERVGFGGGDEAPSGRLAGTKRERAAWEAEEAAPGFYPPPRLQVATVLPPHLASTLPLPRPAPRLNEEGPPFYCEHISHAGTGPAPSFKTAAALAQHAARHFIGLWWLNSLPPAMMGKSSWAAGCGSCGRLYDNAETAEAHYAGCPVAAVLGTDSVLHVSPGGRTKKKVARSYVCNNQSHGANGETPPAFDSPHQLVAHVAGHVASPDWHTKDVDEKMEAKGATYVACCATCGLMFERMRQADRHVGPCRDAMEGRIDRGLPDVYAPQASSSSAASLTCAHRSHKGDDAPAFDDADALAAHVAAAHATPGWPRRDLTTRLARENSAWAALAPCGELLADGESEKQHVAGCEACSSVTGGPCFHRRPAAAGVCECRFPSHAAEAATSSAAPTRPVFATAEELEKHIIATHACTKWYKLERPDGTTLRSISLCASCGALQPDVGAERLHARKCPVKAGSGQQADFYRAK